MDGSRFKLTTFLLVCLVLLAQHGFTQQIVRSRPPLVITKSAVKLVDQFGVMNSEDRSSRFDLLFAEIMQTPGSVGYVFLYCGKQCRYGEIEAHQRGIEIKIALRRFDRKRIVVLNAGFREKFETDLWIATGEGVVPKPESTLSIRFVEFSPSSKQRFEAYDCCDDFTDFWTNIKP